MAVGMGKRPVEWIKGVLEAKDRRLGAETAPPYGLYFLRVEYPEVFQIPGNASQEHLFP
jgi:tRNA pseudouridine38-40 synthase